MEDREGGKKEGSNAMAWLDRAQDPRYKISNHYVCPWASDTHSNPNMCRDKAKGQRTGEKLEGKEGIEWPDRVCGTQKKNYSTFFPEAQHFSLPRKNMMDSFTASRFADEAHWRNSEQDGGGEIDSSNTTNIHQPDTQTHYTITITDAKKIGEGSSAFISYAVTTTSTLPEFTCDNVAVRRRFQDFVALHKTLSDSHPACVMPPVYI